MGISPDVVISSAFKLAQQKGWEQVSVRSIAKEIGYSTMKIYSDFGSKEQLLYEIQKKGFGQLSAGYQEALAISTSPEDALEKLALNHLRFALKHPTYYELMFDHKFNNCKSEAAKIKHEVCKIYLKVIEEIGVEEPQTAFLQLFSMLYGYIKISEEFSNLSDELMEANMKQFVKNFVYGIK
ncbi:MAG: TetR/AcrR family transcriptional regulator [Bacteroidota bacterium]